ncbi:hypothetical protein ONS95_012913 [Cadophora gregata]|uniref:uncharacterized protein n=1 Tax=Cadophora gregata TaxID=51156 RepID=UPI0026DC651A|nr:uncharacterized protein ONS95_012913 [Cadophora gregata]KAK0101103.1 hypothetical protein ONS96_006330 [Cadophora gregata f. sp. sojae]KAK0115865.1 hypothetical protein ONS95_012913 [Cadophora gregata]
MSSSSNSGSIPSVGISAFDTSLQSIQDPTTMSTSASSAPNPSTFDSAVQMPAHEKELRFTLFPKLPLELRDMIWGHSCNEERIIDVRAVVISGLENEDFFMRPEDNQTPKPFQVKSFTYTVPSVLHTSKEARKIGLQHYSLEFGTKIERKVGPATIKISTPARIYVNWNRDLIFQLPPPDKDTSVQRDPIPFQKEMNDAMCKDLMVNRPKLRRVAFSSSPAESFTGVNIWALNILQTGRDNCVSIRLVGI